ncbi:hypothetical protein F511_20260 [Dorcoceras hygrometricum]|uniref:Uncharacterized protein n=1 Tax=Dorcoceras hygrometricum TaxID=472368 RepID=A0A2Z7DH73_9LAMI|nr:hypothetical protein F511_20260 [Dorcoceras hygrometricum]
MHVVYGERISDATAMMAEENKSAWADLDSEEYSSRTSSSRESEDEVQCFMADDTEEIFDFSSPEFPLKAERESCATNDELVGSSNMQVALIGATSFWCSASERSNHVCVPAGCSTEADVNAGQHPCSARRKRRRLASAKEPVDAHIRFPDVNAGQLFCSLQLVLRERNSGFTAGRGFNPAGGAPGGG